MIKLCILKDCNRVFSYKFKIRIKLVPFFINSLKNELKNEMNIYSFS